jgi:PAS domain S-box-containing protein
MPGFDELSNLFGRIPVALYRTAPDGRLLAGNDALAALLGFSDTAEMGRALAEVADVYVDPGQRRRWLEEIAASGVVRDFDVELRRSDESRIWVQDTARAIRDESGEIVFYEGALIDVTEKVLARKARDEFLATVSHELRNPIAVMLGMGEELAQNFDSFSDEDRRDMVHLIARQAEDAAWLIDDLLIAYREDLSQLSLESEVFDVVKETERVLEVIDHPIEVVASGEESLVLGDPRRMRQIVRNLVSNALRYGGEEIQIRIEGSGRVVEICVCDNGPEISETDLARIFEPYARGSARANSNAVGLGLPVARRLARVMSGDLQHRREHGFTCFVLTLPNAQSI